MTAWSRLKDTTDGQNVPIRGSSLALKHKEHLKMHETAHKNTVDSMYLKGIRVPECKHKIENIRSHYRQELTKIITMIILWLKKTKDTGSLQSKSVTELSLSL